MANINSKIIIRLLIVSIITFLVWVGVEVYQLLSKKTLSDVPQEILTPIDPNLDQEVMKNTQNRLTPTQEDLINIPEERKVNFEIKQASPSASPTENQP